MYDVDVLVEAYICLLNVDIAKLNIFIFLKEAIEKI